jgi:hypothetical protein
MQDDVDQLHVRYKLVDVDDVTIDVDSLHVKRIALND